MNKRMQTVATELPPFRIEWGPISEALGAKYGAISGCESVLIRPTVTLELEHIMRRVRALMPEAMFPRHDDTAKSLAKRLAECDFLDDIHVRKGGTGTKFIRLNATQYPQPRRVSWSEPWKDGDDSETEDSVWYLYGYESYATYREPKDWRCRPMPPPVLDLKHYIHSVAKATGRLSEYCAQCEPTACQLMMYYVLFGSHIARHRDNFSHSHFLQYLDGEDVLATMTSGPSASGDRNTYSQVIGSDVLVWTDGPAEMFLSFL